MNTFFENLKPQLTKFSKELIKSKTVKILSTFGSLYIFSNYIHPWINRTPEGFNGNSTAEQVSKDIDLKGKVIIITGSNTGIGKETARVLASKGAFVILSGRDEKKLKEAKEEILQKHKDSMLEIIPVDLGDKESVKNFVEKFKSLNLDL